MFVTVLLYAMMSTFFYVESVSYGDVNLVR